MGPVNRYLGRSIMNTPASDVLSRLTLPGQLSSCGQTVRLVTLMFICSFVHCVAFQVVWRQRVAGCHVTVLMYYVRYIVLQRPHIRPARGPTPYITCALQIDAWTSGVQRVREPPG